MIPRKPLSPNNRKLNQLFTATRKRNQPVKSNNSPSIFGQLRTGRPVDEGYGGGYRVGK